MALSYKTDVLTELIADEVARRGRGTQTRLAEAVDVEVQTVNKWVHGQTHPTPDRWAAIERFFGWNAGEIASRVVPQTGGATTADQLRELQATVESLTLRLTRMEKSLREAVRRATQQP